MKSLPDAPTAQGSVASRPAAARGGFAPPADPENERRTNPAGAVIAADLGTRVRTLRRDAGLTLNDLSERSGVSRAFLSAVERNAKSPTLPIVVRIAKGLNVTMSSLLGVARDIAEVALHRREDRVTFRDPESGFEREVLSPSHADGGVEIVLHRIPPGGSSGLLPAYATAMEKHVVVQEGELTVRLDERTYLARQGDALSFAILSPYEFCNHGDRPCTYIVVMVRRG